MSGVTGAGVAVTGADGFIGRAVVARLLAGGRTVQAVAGPPGTSAGEPGQVPEGQMSAGAELRGRGDLEEPGLLEGLLEGAGAVVHLAGPASVARSFDDPAGYVRVHTGGTARLCAAMAAAGVRRLVLVSSAEVYGRPVANPVAETAATAPRSPYGAAKVGAEAVAGAAARRGELEVVVVRPFSVYGEGMAPWSVLGGLLDAARAGSPLHVRDPRPVRDFVHVDDVAELLAVALEVPAGDAPVVLNAATGVGTSVGELMDVVARVTGVPAGGPAPGADRPAAADLPELMGDPAAAAAFGWTAATTLVDGIGRCWSGARNE
ncbi:MAG: NAD-dependent epimerase/dehydratase family protein [Microthrixaceae bacterium]